MAARSSQGVGAPSTAAGTTADCKIGKLASHGRHGRTGAVRWKGDMRRRPPRQRLSLSAASPALSRAGLLRCGGMAAPRRAWPGHAGQRERVSVAGSQECAQARRTDQRSTAHLHQPQTSGRSDAVERCAREAGNGDRIAHGIGDWVTSGRHPRHSSQSGHCAPAARRFVHLSRPVSGGTMRRQRTDVAGQVLRNRGGNFGFGREAPLLAFRPASPPGCSESAHSSPGLCGRGGGPCRLRHPSHRRASLVWLSRVRGV